MRINIGIHGVRLIAEYRDVDHSRRDDAQFILDNPRESSDKNAFRETVHNFCRSVTRGCLEVVD